MAAVIRPWRSHEIPDPAPEEHQEDPCATRSYTELLTPLEQVVANPTKRLRHCRGSTPPKSTIPIVERNLEIEEMANKCYYPKVKLKPEVKQALENKPVKKEIKVSYFKRLFPYDDSDEPKAADVVVPAVRMGPPITEPVIVTCNDEEGMFYPKKLCRGGHGSCIQYKGEWMTPNQFERAAGRRSTKYWKRSLYIDDVSLLNLILWGRVKEHHRHCTCVAP